MNKESHLQSKSLLTLVGVSAVSPAFLVDAGFLLAWLQEGQFGYNFFFGFAWLVTVTIWVALSVQAGKTRKSIPGNLLTTLTIGAVPLIVAYIVGVMFRSNFVFFLLPVGIITLFCTLIAWSLFRLPRTAVIVLAYTGLTLLVIAAVLTGIFRVIN